SLPGPYTEPAMKIQSQARTHNSFAKVSTPRESSDSSARKLATLLSVLALILATVTLTSCVGTTSAGSGSGNPGSSTGVLSASSTRVSFGNVSVGNNKTQSLTVTNTGSAPVNISQATITGAGYTVIGGNPSNSIAVGQSATVQLQLAPTSAGVDNGTFSIVSDATNSPLNISLTGTGTQAGLTMSPSSI